MSSNLLYPNASKEKDMMRNSTHATAEDDV